MLASGGNERGLHLLAGLWLNVRLRFNNVKKNVNKEPENRPPRANVQPSPWLQLDTVVCGRLARKKNLLEPHLR